MLNGTKKQALHRDRIMTRSQTKKNNVNQDVIEFVASNDVPDSSSISSLAGSPTLLNSDTSYIDEASPLPWLELDPDEMQIPSPFNDSISPQDLAYNKYSLDDPISPLEDVAYDKYLSLSDVSGFYGYCDEDWVSQYLTLPQSFEEKLDDSLFNFPHLYTAKDEFPMADFSLSEEEKLSGELPIDPDQFFSDNMYITLRSSLVSFADDGSKKNEDKAQVNKTQEPVKLAETSKPITPAFKAANKTNSSFTILPERKSKLAAIEKLKLKRPQ
ncbi:MAG: hypothetical protein HYX61_05205 [Gammaproteobacteria bacterium]|nr:hypothetical protein [Gammaproteobacteria bacterium]